MRGKRHVRRVVATAAWGVVACFAVFFFLPTTFSAATANAESARATEYEVKAAYLYNFGKFVRWPESTAPDPSFNLCVLGADPFAGALDQVTEGQRIGGHPVSIRRINSPEGVGGCRVLFVDRRETRALRPALAAARRFSVLTVSDAPEFLQLGGMIQFVLVGDRVRFEVNLDAAHQAGLQLSAELLKVATKVQAMDSSGVGKE